MSLEQMVQDMVRPELQKAVIAVIKAEMKIDRTQFTSSGRTINMNTPQQHAALTRAENKMHKISHQIWGDGKEWFMYNVNLWDTIVKIINQLRETQIDTADSEVWA